MTYFVMPALRRIKPTSERIIREVCEKYSIKEDDLKSKTKVSEIVFARQLAMYLLKEKTNMSLSAIGRTFNRDHSTVIHGIKAIEDYLITDCFGRRDEIKTLTKNL